MVSMPRCGCHGKPARYSRGTSLRKSSRRRKGSNSDVLPKPNARRRCTPAPSRVGLDLMSRLTGRMDNLASYAEGSVFHCTAHASPCEKLNRQASRGHQPFGRETIIRGPTMAKPTQPNILFIMADDIGWFNVSCYNHGIMGYQTPNIDRIAKQGAMFTDFYGQQSCTAGRAAF